jgi:hemerythrin-like metal-binding protein
MTAHSDHPCIPQELETGVAIVDEEHRRLREFIGRLRSICADFACKQDCTGCSAERIGACDAAFLDCMTELLGFMLDHFRHEEQLMKDLGISARQHERYQLHAEDHANIAGRLAGLTRPQPRAATVREIADTASHITRWLDNHIADHDLPMLH